MLGEHPCRQQGLLVAMVLRCKGSAGAEGEHRELLQTSDCMKQRQERG